jgi:[CysO sulfur-carrier protein]-thiocarboxylate-dependent cysteine synthase
MTFDNFAQVVGRTPCVRYRPPEKLHARFWVKLEGYNPTGSVKDRGCLFIVKSAIQRGDLKQGKTLLDASSGNMACSLAYFGAILGYPVTVICSSKLTNDKAAFIRYYGAQLQQIGDFTIDGNLYCRDVLAPSDPDRYVFLDQLRNWDNPRAHYETTGPEIVADLPNLQAVAGSLGSGGTMNGVARYMKEHHPSVRVVTTEAAPGTKIPGTGAFSDGDFVTPFIEQLYELNLVDSRQQVDLRHAEERTKSLAKQGFFCGIQTGAVMEAAIRAAAEMKLDGDILIISGDSGWKNMDKLAAMR